MDEMDYVMHSAEPPSTPQARHHHHLHHHHHPHPPGQHPPLPPQGCPAWRPEHSSPGRYQMLSPIRPSAHRHLPPYDPVHGSSGPWLSPHHSPAFQWSPPVTGPLSPQQPPQQQQQQQQQQLQQQQQQQQQQPQPQPQPQPPHHLHPSRPPNAEPYFGAIGPNFANPTGGGLPPHAFLPNHQFPPPHDPFGPALHFPFRHTSSLPRLGNLPPPTQPLADRDLFHNSTPRSLGLPALHFPPQPPPRPPQAMSSSPSPSTAATQPPSTATPEAPRVPARAGADPTDGQTTRAESPSPQRQEHRLSRTSPHRSGSTGAGGSSSSPPAGPNSAERRRAMTARALRASRRAMPALEGDSDEERDQLEGGDYYHMMREFPPNPAAYAVHFGDMDDRNLRAQQILRGQMVSKRVASRSAISSLQSVEIDSLPETERSCIICYNEFGVPNPEGINEAPLRLPKCKHVFGDHCIKKWFEESDSCPYCRDKVPSEPQVRATHESMRSFLRHIRTSAGPTRPQGQGTESEWVREADLLLALANRDHAAYRRLEQGADASGTWAAGAGRRSPPDTSAENRRRTRPRHSSFRSSPPSGSSSANSSRPNSYMGMGSGGPSLPSAQHQTPFPHLNGPRFPTHGNHSNPPPPPGLRDSIPPYYPMPTMTLGAPPLPAAPPTQYLPVPAMTTAPPDPRHFPGTLGLPPSMAGAEGRLPLPDGVAGAFSQQLPQAGLDGATGSGFGGSLSHHPGY